MSRYVPFVKNSLLYFPHLIRSAGKSPKDTIINAMCNSRSRLGGNRGLPASISYTWVWGINLDHSEYIEKTLDGLTLHPILHVSQRSSHPAPNSTSGARSAGL